jgi:CHAD domain-containing protein
LTWLDDSPKPTQKTLDDAWPQVQYDRNHAAVKAARRARYQAETDGLFFEAQREGGELTAWQAAVDQIKADLPYPTAP